MAGPIHASGWPKRPGSDEPLGAPPAWLAVDVSDRGGGARRGVGAQCPDASARAAPRAFSAAQDPLLAASRPRGVRRRRPLGTLLRAALANRDGPGDEADRSEERRVGKECSAGWWLGQ